MVPVFVITASRDLAASLGRYLYYRHSVNAAPIVLPDIILPLGEGGSRDPIWVRQMFQRVAGAIETEASQQGAGNLKDAIAIIELFDPELQNFGNFTPVSPNLKWGVVVSMLALAFPEVHWIFWTSQPEERVLLNEPLFRDAHVWSLHLKTNDARTHCLTSLDESIRFHARGYRPLFDPTGFRNSIRKRIRDELKNADYDADYLPFRSKVSAAIDEETPYAYLRTDSGAGCRFVLVVAASASCTL